jgi:hypothetical protein
MYVLAYNLIRAVMFRTALSAGLCPRQLSFKGALQAVNGFTAALVNALLVSVATRGSTRLVISLRPRFCRFWCR